MKITLKSINDIPTKYDICSRNIPHPSRICHIPGLSQAQAICSTVDKGHTNNHSKDPTRHTPQTKHVTLMKGLNDEPVCTVKNKLSKLERVFKSYRSLHQGRSLSCNDGLNLDDIGDFKLELVRRHNPHARRVCHIKGLNDVPVCVVRDEINAEWENRFIVSPGSLALVKPKKRFTGDVTDRASRASSRVSVPKMSLLPASNEECDDLNDELDSIQALDILCSILQTNSLQTVQAWIEQATDEERNLVLKALREMKDKGMLTKSNYTPRLPDVPENKVSLSYEKDWKPTKSLEEAPKTEAEPVKAVTPPAVGTQTPVSVIKESSRPASRIQMTGLSRQSSRPASHASRPSTMRSVREKFLSSQMSSGRGAVKDPGFSWAIKHKKASPDVTSKA